MNLCGVVDTPEPELSMLISGFPDDDDSFSPAEQGESASKTVMTTPPSRTKIHNPSPGTNESPLLLNPLSKDEVKTSRPRHRKQSKVSSPLSSLKTSSNLIAKIVKGFNAVSFGRKRSLLDGSVESGRPHGTRLQRHTYQHVFIFDIGFVLGGKWPEKESLLGLGSRRVGSTPYTG
jgi:hypothetical protein